MNNFQSVHARITCVRRQRFRMNETGHRLIESYRCKSKT